MDRQTQVARKVSRVRDEDIEYQPKHRSIDHLSKFRSMSWEPPKNLNQFETPGLHENGQRCSELQVSPPAPELPIEAAVEVWRNKEFFPETEFPPKKKHA
eukprot:1029687-Amphidinium_carterae.1